MPHVLSVSVAPHLSVAQLASRLGVTEDYARRKLLGQPGGIPGIKLSDGPRGQWRIRVCDVEQWEASRIVCYDSAALR